MNKPTGAAFRLKMAKQRAEAFLLEEGICSLPVNPFAIAQSRDIEVRPKHDAEGGVSGMLLRHGDVFGILYATHVESEGFHRFSVGHELGHYFLDGHLDHVLPKDGIHTSHAGFTSSDIYEREADQFSAGLLMPSVPFRKAIAQQKNSGLEVVDALAGLCRTSLTSTAIRYAELTSDAVVIVISEGSNVDFCIMSETIKVLRELTWLKKGAPVPERTLTAELNANRERVRAGDRIEAEIDIMDWLGGVRSVKAIEQSVGLGSYGKTLTVLTCPTVEDDTYREDGEDEEDFEERWTPRFRK